MDRRLQQRYASKLAVTVSDIAAPDIIASGEIVDISESGLCVQLSHALAEGTMVRIELSDGTVFGHVTYCQHEHDCRTGIELVPVLMGQSEFSRMLNSSPVHEASAPSS